jgi:hypothetical protein
LTAEGQVGIFGANVMLLSHDYSSDHFRKADFKKKKKTGEGTISWSPNLCKIFWPSDLPYRIAWSSLATLVLTFLFSVLLPCCCSPSFFLLRSIIEKTAIRGVVQMVENLLARTRH